MRLPLSLFCFGIVAAGGGAAIASAGDTLVYFGTYTRGGAKGIYRAVLNSETGRLSAPELAAECRDPSFLALHPSGAFLYAIDEASSPEKTPGAGVRGYAIDRRTGELTPLNEQSPQAPGPCHLEVDRTGKALLVANYSGGSVASFPIAADGRLGAAVSVITHEGSSVHPTRQKRPHAHAITVAPDNRFALSPDLGTDRVFAYRLDAARAELKRAEAYATPLPPGSGPRHVAFHPSGRWVYVINELLCTMAAFEYSAADGRLTPVQSLSTLPPGETVRTGFSTAEVAVHPGGRFVYGSNRGHDSIVVFAIDPASGRLTYVENEPTQGKTPRHFGIDPSGRWLLAENQNSGTVVVFAIDGATGRLEPTGHSVAVPAAVCAVFLPRTR